MYDQFYGFSGRPFQLTPDPHFYFESGTHRKAMSYLGYGLAQGEGFIVITGDIGAGKTTLVGHLMNSIDPNRLTAVKLVSTAVSGEALLQLVAEQFGLDWDGLGKAELLRSIEQFLREQARAGRRTLLIVDEGQNLPIDALEELRMLSNFQLGGHSLLQIFLLGQPEFRHTLFQSASLEQLRQRVIATHHLDPMEPEEVEPYILHRLGKVGWQGNPNFSPDAIELLFDHSDGVPRRLNVLVSRVLLFGAVEQLNRITGAHVRSVVAEMSADGGFAQSTDAAAAPAMVAAPAPAMVAPHEPVPAPMVFAAPEQVAPEIAEPNAPPFAAMADAPPPVEAPPPVQEAARWPISDVAQAMAPDAVAAAPAAPFAPPMAPATSTPPFAPPQGAGLGRFAAFAVDEPVEPLPMLASASFIEARSLVADHLAASAAPQAAPFAAPTHVPAPPSNMGAMHEQAEPARDEYSSAAAPFAAPQAAVSPSPFAGFQSDEPAEPLDLGTQYSPNSFAAPTDVSSFGTAPGQAELGGDVVVALQRQLAGLEARLADQDAALRRVLDLLIDWVERDPAGAPAAREWAA